MRVKRELEDGWFQHVTLPLPVVLTIQSGIKKLRYATLMGIKKAKSKGAESNCRFRSCNLPPVASAVTLEKRVCTATVQNKARFLLATHVRLPKN